MEFSLKKDSNFCKICVYILVLQQPACFVFECFDYIRFAIFVILKQYKYKKESGGVTWG